MDCITKTVFPDGRIRVSDGVQARELRLDELLDPGNPWGLRAQVYEFQATEERAFHDEATDTNGLYANPIWWELIASKEELEACPDIYWFGEKVITFVNGEMAILPLLARVGDLYSGTQADGILEAVGVIAEAVRRCTATMKPTRKLPGSSGLRRSCSCRASCIAGSSPTRTRRYLASLTASSRSMTCSATIEQCRGPSPRNPAPGDSSPRTPAHARPPRSRPRGARARRRGGAQNPG